MIDAKLFSFIPFFSKDGRIKQDLGPVGLSKNVKVFDKNGRRKWFVKMVDRNGRQKRSTKQKMDDKNGQQKWLAKVSTEIALKIVNKKVDKNFDKSVDIRLICFYDKCSTGNESVIILDIRKLKEFLL